MNAKTAVILLLFLGLAIAALFLMPGKQGGSTPNQDTPGATGLDKPILPESAFGTDLRGLTLAPNGIDAQQPGAMHLERVRARWRIVKPHDFEADTRAIDELLTLMSGVVGKHVEEARPQDPTPGTPGLRLLFIEPDSDYTIKLGPRLGGGRGVVYVAGPDGSSTYHAQDTLHDLFERLDKRVFYARAIDVPLMPEVGRIEILQPDGVSVLRQELGNWWIGEGKPGEQALAQGMPGSPGVSDLFALLNAIELIQQQPYNGQSELAKFGLDKPLITARLQPLTQSSAPADAGLEVRVGVPADPLDETRYLSVGSVGDTTPAVFTAASRYAIAIGQPATTFRDPRLVKIPAALIASIKLTGPRDQQSELAFNPDGSASLRDASAEPKELAREQSIELRNNLAEARALAFIDPGIDQRVPIAGIVLTPVLSRREPETLSIYRDPDSEPDKPTLLVQRGAEPVLLRVERKALQGLLDLSPQ